MSVVHAERAMNLKDYNYYYDRNVQWENLYYLYYLLYFLVPVKIEILIPFFGRHLIF